MKKLWAVMLALLISMVPVFSMAEDAPTLSVWSFTSELPTMITDYYLKDNSGAINMEFTMVDNAEFEAKLDPALMSGEGPDIWGINVAIVKKYVEAGVLADLNEYRDKANEIGIVDYVQSLGTDSSGTLRSLSWQATPGGIWYRRSFAQKYLGVSEPEEVQALLSDMDKLYETAKKIKEASGGKCYFICDAAELWLLVNGQRQSPYVVDDTIVIDPTIPEFFELLKKFTDEDLIYNVLSYQEGWYASMSDSLVDANGETVEIFCYPNATWFLNFSAQPNAKSSDGARDTTGDWGLVEGPSFFFNGGTFLGVNGQSAQLDATKQLFAYLMLDENFLAAYCGTTGDYPASAKVAETLTPTMENPMLGGQNHYLTFNEIAGKIKELYTDKYFDETVANFMLDQAREYAAGNKDMDTALADYQTALMGQYPGLNPAAN